MYMDMITMLDGLALGSFSINTLLENAGNLLQEWGQLISVILGAVLIIVSLVFITQIFLSQQGRGMKAVWAFLAAAAGAFLLVSGFSNMESIGEGLKGTIDQLGNG